MKKFTYVIASIFFLQTATSTVAFAADTPPAQPPAAASKQAVVVMDNQEFNPADFGFSNSISQSRFDELLKLRDEKPYSSLFAPESACAGKEKELDSYINEVATTDGNGNAQAGKYKGKLTEKEMELGDRNFDFEKIMSARFNNQNDEKTNKCLDTYMNMAMGEWFGYFLNQSKEFECGLDFKSKSANGPELEVEANASEKTDSCDIPYGNESLHSFYSKQMEKLKDIHNSYYKNLEDEAKKMSAGQKDAGKTQAAVGCTGPDCDPSSAEAKAAKGIEKFSKEWCCERLSERFEVLGFTTLKDVKPNERVCNELMDKDTETGYCEGSFCTKTIGDCLKNFASVFLRDFFSSLVSSFDVLGWGSQLMTMVKEIISNPYEAGKNIVKNMFGFDGDYMGCLNKKSQSQYVCQMIGKFAGSSAGFSAGLGGIIGLARGAGVGLAKKMAGDKTAKVIKPALTDAVKTGAKAAAVGTVWPYYAARGAVRGTVGIVKGTWKHTPFIASKVARVTVSAVPEASGRAAQMMGRSFVKRGGDDAVKAGEALQNAGARRVQRAQEIRAGGSRQSTAAVQTSAKHEPIIAQAEAAVKSIDDQIAALQSQQNKLIEGATIKNGKPHFAGSASGKAAEFSKNNTKINELKKTKAERESKVDEAKKTRDDELKKIGDADSAAGNRIRNNVKGTVLGVGAAGSQYPANGNKPAKPENKPATPSKDDVPVAAPVQGVGTGEGVPKPKGGEKKPEAVAPPAAAPPAAAPAAAPAPAANADPGAPPGF